MRRERRHTYWAAALASGLGLSGAALAEDLYSNGTLVQRDDPVFLAETPKPPPKDWADEIKQPVDWFKWGADERLRMKQINNPFFLDVDPPGKYWTYTRLRTRVWGNATPTDNIDLNLRLTWESRYWWNPESKPDPASRNEGLWDWSDVVFDHLNVRVKNLFDGVGTLTVGRQDIIFGDGWLVLDGTPLDGSRTIYFDLAGRLSLDFKEAKTAVDLVALQVWSDPDTWLPPINSRSYPAHTEQDQTAAILYVTNKSLEQTQIDGYFIWKHSVKADTEPGVPFPNTDQGDIYTLGTRIVHQFNANWTAKFEGAYQFGNRKNPALFGTDTDTDVSAFGVNPKLTYSFNDDWKQQVWVGYEVLSGDDPGGTNTQFDPLWGRWPQWSELYIYSFATETRIAEITNIYRLAIGWQAVPDRKMDLAAAYHALWAPELTRHDQGAIGFGDDNFRGHLLTAVLRYKFNKNFAGHLWAEYFIPGGFYEDQFPRNDDPAAFFRAELMITF